MSVQSEVDGLGRVSPYSVSDHVPTRINLLRCSLLGIENSDQGHCAHCSPILKRAFDMTDDTEQTAKETVDFLEQRLRRIEYFLTGQDPAHESLQEVAAEGKDRTVLTRLSEIEHNLSKLASGSPVISDLLKICELPTKTIFAR